MTGKYQHGHLPEGSRKTTQPELGGRVTDRVFPAVTAYLDIAERHGLDPVHMALAFCVSRPFMGGSTIFGTSSLEQLERILTGQDLILSEEVMAEIDHAHRAHAMPY